jgi:hypothetical protein
MRQTSEPPGWIWEVTAVVRSEAENAQKKCQERRVVDIGIFPGHGISHVSHFAVMVGHVSFYFPRSIKIKGPYENVVHVQKETRRPSIYFSKPRTTVDMTKNNKWA